MSGFDRLERLVRARRPVHGFRPDPPNTHYGVLGITREDVERCKRADSPTRPATMPRSCARQLGSSATTSTLLFGIAFGFEDEAHPANAAYVGRVALEEVTTFHD